MDVRRLPITVVGKLEMNPDGSAAAIPYHWEFGSSWLPRGTEVPVEPDALGGWTLVELHAIAHGLPCDCAVQQAIDATSI